MRYKGNLLLTFLVIFIIGCSSQGNDSVQKSMIPLNEDLFQTTSPVISESALYQLSKQQQQDFLNFYQSQSSKGYLPHEVVKRFLESKLSNFSYYGKTYSANEAMERNSGNCMSLAILTTALSRLIDVDMSYRKMHSLPIYEKHGNVVLSSSHVQSLLYDPSFIPEKNVFYVNRPAIVIDYFPQEDNIRSKLINSNDFLAMYYINKGAEFYIEGDYDNTFAFAKRAYELDSNNASAINLLALLHKKKGDEITAEQLYLTALESSDANISVLDNYVNLLKKQGRFDRAQKIKQRIENIYDPNPYHWLEKAQLARYQGEFDDSIRFYRKVIELTPYVKQAYLELHEVYILQGNKSSAITTLQSSLPWLHEPKQKRQYKKKLYQLSAAI